MGCCKLPCLGRSLRGVGGEGGGGRNRTQSDDEHDTHTSKTVEEFDTSVELVECKTVFGCKTPSITASTEFFEFRPVIMATSILYRYIV